jgi:hypothetical protein
MSWFRVDDHFYSHPKVLATSLSPGTGTDRKEIAGGE